MKFKELHIILLFIFITLATSLKVVGTMSYYILDSENFVERFCVNKDKPELKCDGKCELAKMLQQEKQASDNPINMELIKSETVLFLCSFITLNLSNLKSNENVEVMYSNQYSFRFLSTLEYPPEV